MHILGVIASSISGNLALPGSFESIATASGGVGTITFSSIPSTYTHLQIRIMARNTNNSTTQEFGNIDIRFNNDSAANYSDHTFVGNGASVSTYANFTNRTVIGVTTNPCADLTANCFGVAVINILDYANTNKFKTTKALSGGDFNGAGSTQLQSGNWRSTSAINRIDLISYGGTTYNSNTRIALYGIKSA